jgi:hypothetical protein
MSEPTKPTPHSPSWSASETWTAVALFLGTVLSRVPFRSHILYHWDSVNFAFGMQRFDVAAEQPQPPGYIAYVWLCRLVDLLFHDPQTTMVWISIVGSGMAVVAMYLSGRAMFDRRTGLVGALFLTTSPLFWFYGEIALPHALDTFLVILSAWLLWEVMHGRTWAVVPAAVSLAVAGGVRQQTPVFLGLAALCAAVGLLCRVGWARGLRWGALAVVVFGLLCAGWFIPLVNSAGGLDGYLQVMGDFSARFNATTSLFMGAGSFGLTRNLRKLGMYTAFGWSVALVPLVLYAVQRVWQRRFRVRWERALFLLAGMLPALFFYGIVHMGQQGLVFVFLPALLLLSAVGLLRLLGSNGEKRWAVYLMTAGLVTCNGAVFLLAPEYPLGVDRLRLLTRATLVNSDRYYEDRFEAIKANFAPKSTAILADNWHHVEYYLPKHTRLPFSVVSKWEKDEGSPRGNPQEVVAAPIGLGLQLDGRGQATIVIFDPDLMAFNESPTSAHELPLKHEGTLEYFVLTGDQAFHYGASSFGLRNN